MCVRPVRGVAFHLAILLSVLREVQPQNPSFLIEPRDEVIVLQGEYTSATITLHCYVINLKASHTLSWYKDNYVISNNNNFSLINGMGRLVDEDRYSLSSFDSKLFTLTIQEVTSKTAVTDSGRYQCVVRENDEIIIQTPIAVVEVYVISTTDSDYPKCIPDASPLNYTAGKSVTVTCVTLANIPETRLEWSRRHDNKTLTSTRSGISEDGRLYAEYEWTVSADDDGTTLICSETHPSHSTYRTCRVGPLTVSSTQKTASVGFTTTEIIGISVGATLALIALIIILIVVIALKVRRPYEEDDFEYNNRKYEVTAASDFGWQGTATKSTQQQTDTSGQTLGLGTVSLQRGDVYWKQRSEQAPPVDPDIVTGTGDSNNLAGSQNITRSQTSVTSSRSKSSHRDSVNDVQVTDSDVITKDVDELNIENYESLSELDVDDDHYTKLNTLVLT